MSFPPCTEPHDPPPRPTTLPRTLDGVTVQPYIYFFPFQTFLLTSSLYIHVVYLFHFYRNELIPPRFAQAMTTEIDLIFFLRQFPVISHWH